LLKDPALKLDMKAEKSVPNQFGIYHDTYRPRRDDANRRVAHCYYLCDPDGNKCVNSPPVGKWYDTVPQSFDEEIQALERASRNKEEQRQFPADVIDLVSKAKHALVHKRDKLEDERAAKRSRLLEINNSCHSSITLRLFHYLTRKKEERSGVL
jgi:hypothetical protein